MGHHTISLSDVNWVVKQQTNMLGMLSVTIWRFIPTSTFPRPYTLCNFSLLDFLKEQVYWPPLPPTNQYFRIRHYRGLYINESFYVCVFRTNWTTGSMCVAWYRKTRVKQCDMTWWTKCNTPFPVYLSIDYTFMHVSYWSM